MFNYTVIILLLIINCRQYLLQQIFYNKPSLCTFNNDDLPKNERKIEMENTFWDITGSNRDQATHVMFSLCGALPPNQYCDSSATICISNTKKPSRNIKNAGEYFQYTTDNGKKVLKSVNGEKCDDGPENFTVIIQFESNPEVSVKPKFVYMGECELRLEMMWPLYTPPCTMKENGNLIDLRPLKKLMNFLVYEPELKKNYSLSICKKSDICGTDSSVCQINDKVVSISKIEHLRVTYGKHGLVIKSHSGDEKRIRKYFELHLKCNWKIDDVSNLVAVKSVGKTHRFTAESSLACIKFPTDCLVRSKMNTHLLYDLSNLNHDYEVQNVSNGRIIINICGSLNFPRERSECSDQYSQVCYQSNTNVITNLGSISTKFEVTSNYAVKGTFLEGSVCVANTNFTYSTEIEFICKETNQGPILKEFDKCRYKIEWHTTAACPKYSPQGDNCILQSPSGTVNLQNMYKSSDRQISLSETTLLRFNLCGALKQPCNNISDAAVCFIEEGKERLVGSLNKHLIIEDNNVLTLNMLGHKFKNKICDTKIKFLCKLLVHQEEEIYVNIKTDKCNFEIIIQTPLACGPITNTNCTFLNNNLFYNLSGLLLEDYSFKRANKIYYLNVCRSVINSDDLLCPLNSGICMKDMNEPHLQFRHKSLGTITSVSTSFDNNDLILSYKSGSYCLEATSLMRSSVIHFQCSTTEEGPIINRENACHHELYWRTPHACPIRIKNTKLRSTTEPCQYLDNYNDRIVDLGKVKYRIITYDIYKLYLCKNVYFECKNEANSSCVSKSANVSMISNDKDLYLSYVLDHECTLNKIPNEIRLHLICTDNDDNLESDGLTDCILNLKLNTAAVCTNKKITGIEKEKVEEQIYCPYSSLQSIDMKILKNTEITSSQGLTYTLNFENRESSCPGLICKGGSNILPFSDSKCPFIEYNYTYSFALLQYKTKEKCSFDKDTYIIKFYLKCNLENSIPNIVEESNCTVAIEYPVSEMCAIFSSKTLSAGSSGIVVGLIVGLVMVAIAAIVGFIFYKKHFKKNCYSSIRGSKENMKIYLKDTTL